MIFIKTIVIEKIIAREVFDSRGTPTIEAEVYLSNNVFGSAIVPSGASTGKYEALELRDFDRNRLFGKGVLKAVNNINTILNDNLKGMRITNIFQVDKKLLEIDSSENKSNLGANALLAVSMAFYNAIAKVHEIDLFGLFGGANILKTPIPMLNILNGGVHASNNLDIQEFMIIPVNFLSFKEAFVASVEVYHSLKGILKEKGYSTTVGDEGGFAPSLSSHEEALDLIIQAIRSANYIDGENFMIGIDAASSEWKTQEKGKYYLPKSKKSFTSHDLVSYWEDLCRKYPIYSIEDGLDEDDIDGWMDLTERLKDKILLIGDDLFVTNSKRLKEGIKKNIANAILIKPNQIGTVYETITTINIAKKANYKVILSHRSGETEDTTIASLAVGVQADFIKIGAPCRSERVAKYNELLRIEEKLTK